MGIEEKMGAPLDSRGYPPAFCGIIAYRKFQQHIYRGESPPFFGRPRTDFSSISHFSLHFLLFGFKINKSALHYA